MSAVDTVPTYDGMIECTVWEVSEADLRSPPPLSISCSSMENLAKLYACPLGGNPRGILDPLLSLISPDIEFIQELTNGCQPNFLEKLAKSCTPPPRPKEIPDHPPPPHRRVSMYMTRFIVHWQFIVFSRFVIDINWFSVVVECWAIHRYRNICLGFSRLVASMTIDKKVASKNRNRNFNWFVSFFSPAGRLIFRQVE